MAHELFLGIDLGGTAIKVGLTDGRDGLLGQATVATPHAGPGEVVAAMVVAAAQRAAAAAGVSLAAVVAAGVASPGALDTKAGVVIGAANLPGLKDAPLRELLGAALGVPVVLENDANAAA
jgi:glucokinase